jgi:hypothetical protein
MEWIIARMIMVRSWRSDRRSALVHILLSVPMGMGVCNRIWSAAVGLGW